MSDIGWCIVGFGFLTILTGFLAVLWRSVVPSLGETVEAVKRAAESFKLAAKRGERTIVAVLTVLRAARVGYMAAIVSIFTAGTSLIAAICGLIGVPALIEVLLDAAERLSQLLRDG